MSRVWVKGYTKKDGTKVPGHYRDMEKTIGVMKKKIVSARARLEKARKRHETVSGKVDFDIDTLKTTGPANKMMRLKRQVESSEKRLERLKRGFWKKVSR